MATGLGNAGSVAVETKSPIQSRIEGLAAYQSEIDGHIDALFSRLSDVLGEDPPPGEAKSDRPALPGTGNLASQLDGLISQSRLHSTRLHNIISRIEV